MKKIYGISLFTVAALAVTVCAQPAHAGSWSLTGSVSGSASPGSEATPGLDVTTDTSTEYAFFASYLGSSISESYTFTGAIQWVGGGTQPSTVALTETGDASAGAAYSEYGTFSVSDGLGDPQTNWATSGAGQEPPYPSSGASSQGTHTTTVSIAPGAVYKFSRTLSAAGSGGAYDTIGVSYSASIP